RFGTGSQAPSHFPAMSTRARPPFLNLPTCPVEKILATSVASPTLLRLVSNQLSATSARFWPRARPSCRKSPTLVTQRPRIFHLHFGQRQWTTLARVFNNNWVLIPSWRLRPLVCSAVYLNMILPLRPGS